MTTPTRKIQLTDQAALEFFENESPTVKTRRKLSFKAPAIFVAGADLILPEDNSIDGVLLKDGSDLSWEPIDVTGDIAAALAAHVAQSDPHTQYQKESEKAAASGYASLDSGTLVPTAQLGGGSPGAGNFLRGDRSWSTITLAELPGGADLFYFRQVGTMGGSETWYPAGAVGASTIGVGFTTVIDTIYAVPYYTGRGGRLDRMGVEMTSFANANMKMRFGIYASTSDTDLYPGTKIYGSNEFVGGVNAIKTETISQTLSANKLVWFVILCGGTGGNPACRAMSGASGTGIPCLGALSAAAALRQALSASQSYGALPTNFPGSPTFILNGAAFPLLSVRYDQ